FEGMALDDYFEIIQTSGSGPEDMTEENTAEDAPPADEAAPKEDAPNAPSAPDQSHGGLISVAQPGLPGQRKVWLNPPTPDDVQDGEATPSPASTGSPPSETSPEADASPEAEATNAPAHNMPGMVSEADEIAVVYATGAIVPGRGTPDQIGGDRLAKTLRELRQDKTVAAVVLRLNSRGGSATASEIIAREVELTAQEKPVVVSMGDYAASGGYWIAAPADEIVAEPTTITGSIGVFGLLPNVQKLGENNGVTWDAIQTGPLANLQTITRPKSDAELALLQSSVDWVYGQFIAKVAEGRSLETNAVEEIAQGRVWSGRAAADVGLVDQLGGLETAIARAAELAELGDDWTIQEYPKSRGFGGLFPFSSSSSLEDALADLLITAGDRLGIWAWLSESRSVEQVALAHWTAWRSQLDWLATLNDPNGTYAKSFDAWDIR
ncbi:MAG: signal peptide peptidase SppA, partial [Cyanobacteria bacterium P01_H01_bin.130]